MKIQTLVIYMKNKEKISRAQIPLSSRVKLEQTTNMGWKCVFLFGKMR